MNFDNDKLKGLDNVGNTCFFNSVLQLLYQCTVINKLIILNNLNGDFIGLYKDFLCNYINSTSNSFAPIDILSNVTKSFTKFNLSQEDADQYMTYIIDKLVEEIKSNENYLIQNKNQTLNDLIDALFNIQMKKSIICKKCNYKSTTDDTINKLYLSVCLNNLELNKLESNKLTESTNFEKLNLHDLLKCYMTEEIDLDSFYVCEQCNTNVSALIYREILSLPKYLFITIKRYSNLNKKIISDIYIPMIIQFDLKKKYIYQLRGFIYHMGSTNGGHYVYYGLRQSNWYLFNDSNVSNVDLNSIENFKNSAYIYLYTQKNNF